MTDVERSGREHSWNLMTPMTEYLKRPLIIERGEGCWLYDIEGKRYFDGNASMWTCVHGHSNAELNEALVKQLGRFADTTTVCRSHVPMVELSRKLAEIGPEGLTRAFFTNNGSTAIEAALKMSFQYWQMAGKAQKRKVISMCRGHHGLSFGAMSVGDNPGMHHRFRPWAFECETFKSPQPNDDGESIADLRRLLEEIGSETACVVLEASIQCVGGETGILMQPKGFLGRVKALCEEFDVHLVLDEVFVGFGRSGPMFACKAEGVSPDFLCLGKGITSGYLPRGATLTREDIYEAFNKEAFIHGHTYGGNALASAVAYKSITMLEERMASGEHTKGIEDFKRITERYFKDHDYVRNYRQRGYVCAIDLYPEGVGKGVSLYALEKGLIIRAYMDSIFIIPPIVANEEEMEFLCKTLSESIAEYIGNCK